MADTRTRREIFEDYEGFVDKFKPKKTTDDCYTPPEIYDVVLKWVGKNMGSLDGLTVRRPFYPGGDYQSEAENYGPDDVVVDNPPFSKLCSIARFYVARGIRFFLFCPANSFSHGAIPGVTCVAVYAKVTYQNGACVATSFLTNMDGRNRVIIAGDLRAELDACIKAMSNGKRKRAALAPPRYDWDERILTPGACYKFCRWGVNLKIPIEETAFTRTAGPSDRRINIFGGGFLLSERAAAERAAAERAAAERAAAERAAAERDSRLVRVELSPGEVEICRSLGRVGFPTTNSTLLEQGANIQYANRREEPH